MHAEQIMGGQNVRQAIMANITPKTKMKMFKVPARRFLSTFFLIKYQSKSPPNKHNKLKHELNAVKSSEYDLNMPPPKSALY